MRVAGLDDIHSTVGSRGFCSIMEGNRAYYQGFWPPDRVPGLLPGVSAKRDSRDRIDRTDRSTRSVSSVDSVVGPRGLPAAPSWPSVRAPTATKATKTVASVLGQVDDEKDERCGDGEDRCEEQALA